MFATIQNMIGLVKPREAESTDARLDMHRRINSRNRHNLDLDSNGREVYDHDEETISVQSALLFLEGFLESRLDRALEDNHKIHNLSPAPWTQTVSSNQNINEAARNAYQHAAEISSEVARGTVHPQKLHKHDELKLIYQLIQDLRDLAARGVEQLKIDSGSSFLEAIIDAVAFAKAH